MKTCDRCDRCGGWQPPLYGDVGRMPCNCELFHIRIPDQDGDDWTKIWSRSLELALTKYAEQADQDDHELMCGITWTAEVGDAEGNVLAEYELSGEAVATYHARAL